LPEAALKRVVILCGGGGDDEPTMMTLLLLRNTSPVEAVDANAETLVTALLFLDTLVVVVVNNQANLRMVNEN
jgi:hypothetical protein